MDARPVVDILHILLKVVARVLGVAVQLLLLVVDDLGAAIALGFGQAGALGLQLLGQAVDLVAKGLEGGLLGRVLLLEVGEVALAFVGLGHGQLKGDDGDFGGHGDGRGSSGRCNGAGSVWAAALRTNPEASIKLLQANASFESKTPSESHCGFSNSSKTR